MFSKTLITWNVSLFLVIILNLSSSSPVNPTKNDSMYEALSQKCPQLEDTKLQKNLVNIFTSECVNWTAINATDSLVIKEKDKAQCLVLYESILSFCTRFGDRIAKYKNLIPTLDSFSNYTVERICSNNQLHNSLNKTEHNISNILQSPINCMYMCGDLENSRPVVSNICKFSYYFATFDVDTFLAHSKLLNLSPSSSSKHDNNIIPSEEIPIQPSKISSESGKDSNLVVGAIGVDGINEPKKGAGKPKHTVIDEESQIDGNKQALLSDHELPLPHNLNPSFSKNNSNVKDNQVNVVPIKVKDSPHKSEVNNAVEAESSVEDKPSKNLDTGGKKLQDPDVKNEPQVDPESDRGQVAQPPDNVNSVEANVEKVQDKLANGDDQELSPEEEEAEQEDANAKAEPVMPEEVEQPMPVKKAKPNTVEDVAVSNYNTPEDDMDGDSYFFSYFTVFMCLFVIGYVGYHNRQKILALLLEGKKGKRCGRQGRRPNSANYHKLDSNLEEAISSSCTKSASNVIY